MTNTVWFAWACLTTVAILGSLAFAFKGLLAEVKRESRRPVSRSRASLDISRKRP